MDTCRNIKGVFLPFLFKKHNTNHLSNFFVTLLITKIMISLDTDNNDDNNNNDKNNIIIAKTR